MWEFFTLGQVPKEMFAEEICSLENNEETVTWSFKILNFSKGYSSTMLYFFREN